MPRKTASRTGTPRTRNTRTEWWDATAEHPAVEIVRSSRRTKTVSGAMNPDGSLRLLVPASSTRHDIQEYLQQLAPKIMARAQQQGQRKRKSPAMPIWSNALNTLLTHICPKPACPMKFAGSPTKRPAGVRQPRRPRASASLI